MAEDDRERGARRDSLAFMGVDPTTGKQRAIQLDYENWHWYAADARQATLPEGHADRFREKLI